jgi:hypothetical protein
VCRLVSKTPLQCVAPQAVSGSSKVPYPKGNRLWADSGADHLEPWTALQQHWPTDPFLFVYFFLDSFQV